MYLRVAMRTQCQKGSKLSYLCDTPEGNLIIIEFTVGNVLVSFLLLLVQWF